MTTSEKMNDMMIRLRPMAVLSDGIWQRAEGVWTDIGAYKARVILQGRELMCDGKHFLDLDGYGPSDVAMEIVRRNLSTLPKQQRKSRQILEPPQRPRNEVFYQPYRVVNRNGRPHAVPYPQPMPIEDLPPLEPPHQVVYEPPAQEGPGNNV